MTKRRHRTSWYIHPLLYRSHDFAHFLHATQRPLFRSVQRPRFQIGLKRILEFASDHMSARITELYGHPILYGRIGQPPCCHRQRRQHHKNHR